MIGIWLTAPVTAQQNLIAGSVVDSKSLRPLFTCTSSGAGPGRGLLTDANGRFRIQNVPGTDVTVEVVMLGY